MTDPVASPSPTSGGVFNDLKILWHLVVSRATGNTHEERLESFYKGQAGGYDAFRQRLLHGRDDLFQSLPAVNGGVWVDLGAGTGENAERWGDRLKELKSAYLVDLSSSLLKVADQRIAARGWTNVSTVHGDATQFLPPEGAADVVTMSYSLTMIPDWFLAVDQAFRMLKPGGTLGVVDFFVARKYPRDGLAAHRWSTRTFWPPWFASDNVFLNPDHIPYLQSRFETVSLHQRRGKVPYLPFVRAPHYLFVGRKHEEP
ncbi:MAG: class I SAM-dependent methyltransferase [Planctomycetaceae bacterium]|nr:class I SAM-dependent methyltransferase [Planctomycetaceae bacterium]